MAGWQALDEAELAQLTSIKAPKISPVDVENLLFVQESGELSQLTSIECVAMGARSTRALHALALTGAASTRPMQKSRCSSRRSALKQQ